MTERSEHNIAARSAEERERVNIDLVASGLPALRIKNA